MESAAEHVRLAYPQPELADGLIRLRQWCADDIDCIRQAATAKNIRDVSTVPAEYTPEEGRAYIERQWSRLATGVGVSMAIADAGTDRAIGQVYVGVRQQPFVTSLGYWVLPAVRGRGIATRAAGITVGWVLDTVRAARIEAWAAVDNPASQRVLMAAGFQREGVLRAYLGDLADRTDAVMFSLLPTDSRETA